ncbi:hypothetical protein ES677_00385 [Bizionia gelidisalsuginis]|uniref:Uncharacterized protein n=1 Tax=Bizionia gelidisalsuginis TaxID=291188 RepID=A0ABY3ME37_9FLAO|nr:hypothetical protein [Bizionia gelidisalsuginis]TYC17868.1 hypothetical protein ES677_00385 [Bizionia gelidisalsuginis]
MKNDYLLQNEFNDWLKLRFSTLSFKSTFYDTQLLKLNKLSVFNEGNIGLLEAIENEILCDNDEGVEALILNVLEKMEQRGIKHDLKINTAGLDGLRSGLLKYRLFLFDFLALRSIKYQSAYTTASHLWEIKSLQLEAVFNGDMRYSLPIYGDNYTYNKGEIDTLWEHVLLVNTSNESGLIDEPIQLESILECILVRPLGKNQLEVIDGGNAIILLSLLLHTLYEFSESTNNRESFEAKAKIIPQLLSVNTKLNDQKLFRVLIHNGINKRATTPNTISKGIVYKCEEPGLNMGFHFLQTTFRFVQLIQASKIPQSEHYIKNMDVFIERFLKTVCINRKQLTVENCSKTYLNNTTILLKNVMEWL